MLTAVYPCAVDSFLLNLDPLTPPLASCTPRSRSGGRGRVFAPAGGGRGRTVQRRSAHLEHAVCTIIGVTGSDPCGVGLRATRGPDVSPLPPFPEVQVQPWACRSPHRTSLRVGGRVRWGAVCARFFLAALPCGHASVSCTGSGNSQG